MKKILKMSLIEIKQFQNLLIAIATAIILITVSVVLSKNNKDLNIVFLGFADILEKLLIPVFIYIGSKNYIKALNNNLQINQKRSYYFLAKSLSMIAMSFTIAFITTPLSYYFAGLGMFDSKDLIMPVFIGTYSPIIPIIYNFSNITLVTIISALIYSFFAHMSLLIIALHNKIGGVKLFILFSLFSYILIYLNNALSVKSYKYGIMDRILGFAGNGINLLTPLISISIITMIVSTITYITIYNTELKTT